MYNRLKSLLTVIHSTNYHHIQDKYVEYFNISFSLPPTFRMHDTKSMIITLNCVRTRQGTL
jgi:hypothetical protein